MDRTGVMSTPSTFNIVGGMIGKSGEAPTGGGTGNAIPAGTYTGNDATSSTWTASEVVAVVLDEETNSDENVIAFSRIDFTIEKTATGMRVQVAQGLGTGPSVWYGTSGIGSSNTLTSTPVTIYTNNNATFTAFKVEQTIAVAGGSSSGTWDDNGGDYVSTPSTGSTVTYSRSRLASENIIGSTTFEVTRVVIAIYGRATGYDDTLLARFAFEVQAEASRV